MTVNRPLRIIVAGGRDFDNFRASDRILGELLDSIPGQVEFVSGEAKGADEAPYLFKLSYGLHYKDKLVGITPFEPDWEQNGKAAGILRNRDMALYADCLVAFWDGESRGTKHMIETMMELDKPFLLYGFNGRRL